MRTLLRGLIILVAAGLLAACGGGGGGGQSGRGGGGGFEPPGGVEPENRIEFQVARQKVPANVVGVEPFLGSPYISEIKVTALRSDGRLVPNGTVLNFNVFPTEVGVLSTPDDPETDDINEFFVFLESGFNETNSGQIQLYFHALDKPGTATVRVTLEDENTGNVIAGTTQIEVVSAGSTLLPADISLSRQDRALYIQGSGGSTSLQVEAVVEDDAGQPVPDPEDFNNLQVSLVNDGPSLGASLRGTDHAGNVVTGNSISTATTNGRAIFSLRSGDQPGVQTVRITADRSDNNVDNGIGDALSEHLDVTISDGRLFSLTLTSPNVNTIRINRVDPEVELEEESDIPPDPDGTLSLTVSVQANDRRGNPVVPGTEIQFGLIDFPIEGFPLSGSGTFAISGPDGDPREGLRVFNAPGSGAFTSAGGGVELGDTLVLFGEEAPPGNAEHEGSRIVEEVISDTRLRVTTRFNRNDGTGQSADHGPVIPYAIGRARHGSLGGAGGRGSAFTDENGVATLKLTYPMSQVGRSAILWAQGAGAVDAEDQTTTVGEVALAVYPGVAPVILSASPTQVPANTEHEVLICAQDALSVPIRGAFIDFNVTNAQGATVSVDGQEGSGTVVPATAGDGCTTATVDSLGVSPAAENIPIVFSLGGATATVEIVPDAGAVLFAIPNVFRGNGNKEILLRLLTPGGAPIPGVQIDFLCENTEDGSVSMLQPPGTTNSNGETTAVANAQVDNTEGGGRASCTFFPVFGPPPEALVEFIGFDLCQFSPLLPACEDDGEG